MRITQRQLRQFVSEVLLQESSAASTAPKKDRQGNQIVPGSVIEPGAQVYDSNIGDPADPSSRTTINSQSSVVSSKVSGCSVMNTEMQNSNVVNTSFENVKLVSGATINSSKITGGKIDAGPRSVPKSAYINYVYIEKSTVTSSSVIVTSETAESTVISSTLNNSSIVSDSRVVESDVNNTEILEKSRVSKCKKLTGSTITRSDVQNCNITLATIEDSKIIDATIEGTRGEGGVVIQKAFISGAGVKISGQAQVGGLVDPADPERVQQAVILENAKISGNAQVSGTVKGNAEVSGNAEVHGLAIITGDCKVSGTAKMISGKYTTGEYTDGDHTEGDGVTTRFMQSLGFG